MGPAFPEPSDRWAKAYRVSPVNSYVPPRRISGDVAEMDCVSALTGADEHSAPRLPIFPYEVESIRQGMTRDILDEYMAVFLRLPGPN